jgi:hypothetical protein
MIRPRWSQKWLRQPWVRQMDGVAEAVPSKCSWICHLGRSSGKRFRWIRDKAHLRIAECDGGPVAIRLVPEGVEPSQKFSHSEAAFSSRSAHQARSTWMLAFDRPAPSVPFTARKMPAPARFRWSRSRARPARFP